MIEYVEPIWGDGGAITGDIVIQITEADAIAHQRKVAAQNNVCYLRDQDALMDFIVINWAKRIPDDESLEV